jgi:hydroxymethylbilane synthase
VNSLRIGTRRSALALWQARHVAGLIEAAAPGRFRVELVEIVTGGDRFQTGPLPTGGGKGLFTKEIEEALASGAVDLAVHSLKDLPASLGPGLVLAQPPPREDARDALCTRGGRKLAELPRGARVGTSSLRRTVQLRALRPDLELVPVRGNVPTRLERLDEAGLHGVVLAAAGLRRLGLAERISEFFDPHLVVPAVGQGILGLEHRAGDSRVADALAPLADARTHACAQAERSLLGVLGVGCTVPMGAHAWWEGEALRLEAVLVDPESGAQQRVTGVDHPSRAADLGSRLGRELVSGPLAHAIPPPSIQPGAHKIS